MGCGSYQIIKYMVNPKLTWFSNEDNFKDDGVGDINGFETKDNPPSLA